MFKISDFHVYLKKLEKEQIKYKINTKKEIVKIGVEINEVVNRQTTGKINKTKHWFLEKINKIYKPLAR